MAVVVMAAISITAPGRRDTRPVVGPAQVQELVLVKDMHGIDGAHDFVEVFFLGRGEQRHRRGDDFDLHGTCGCVLRHLFGHAMKRLQCR